MAATSGEASGAVCVDAPTVQAMGQAPTPVVQIADESAPRYRFESVFASGGLGIIRLAHDDRLCRRVAVKNLRTFVRGSVGERRFIREALITARLEHPSIIPIYDLGVGPDGEPYYCMKLVEGRSLQSLVRERRTVAERVSLVPHVLAIADAIAFAHDRGVIHRDLKPANVMVGAFGETVVIDWGLAKDLAELVDDEGTSAAPTSGRAAELTQTGEFVGTLPFMPPEQAEGARLDARADVYSIGAILYNVLTGRLPYEHDSAPAVLYALIAGTPPEMTSHAPDLPPDLVAIVRKAMARARDARYSTAKELAADLRRFQAGRLVAARVYRSRDLLFHFVGRHRAILTVAAIGLLFAVLLGAYSYTRVVGEREIADARREDAERASTAEAAARAVAELQTREARRSDVRQRMQSARDALFVRREPQRALAHLTAAYRHAPDDAALRKLLADAAAWTSNLKLTLDDVYGAEFNRSGDRLLTWRLDEFVDIWDPRDYTHLYQLRLGATVGIASFLPDGDDVGVATYDRELQLYRAGAPVWRQAFTPGGLLASPRAGEPAWVVDEEGVHSLALASGEVHPVFHPSADTRLFTPLGVRSDGALLLETGPTGVLIEHWPATVRCLRAGGRGCGDHKFLRNRAHSLVASVDGRYISYVAEVGVDTVVLLDTTTGQRWPLPPCGGAVDVERNIQHDPTAAFSPDDTWLVRLLGSRQIARWNTTTHACEASRGELDSEYERVAVAGDGRSVVLLGKTGTIGVLDATSLALREKLLVDTRPVERFTLNPRASQVVTINQDHELKIWELGDPRLVHSEPARDLIRGRKPGEVVVLRDDPTGKRRTLELVAPGEQPLPFADSTAADYLHRDQRYGEFVVASDAENTFIELWSVTDRRRLTTVRGDGALRNFRSFAVSPERQRLVLSAPGPSYEQWTAGMLISTDLGEPAVVELATRSPGFDHMTLNARPRGLAVMWSARLYDLDTGALLATLPGLTGNFSPDGEFLFVTKGDDSLDLYDAATGGHLRQLLPARDLVGHISTSSGHAAVFSPDGASFAFARSDGSITLWDAEHYTQQDELHGHFHWPGFLLFDPTSSWLLSSAADADADGQVFLWDLDSGRGRLLEVPDVTTVAFAPNTGTLAIGSANGVVRLWDMSTGTRVGELRDARGGLELLEFSTDEDSLLAGADERLHVWRIELESRSPRAMDQFIAEMLPPGLIADELE